ncbi:MAG: DEAD/DEAH box helicase [Alphaproteobacteria bacterium]
MSEATEETGIETEAETDTPKNEFAGLGLGDPVLNAITDAGYSTPTPIQAEAIPHVLAGKDVMGIAQTGTGKTASFTLPMIDRLAQGRAKARMPRSLILCPTRELAAQVAENFTTYGKYHKLSMALLIGGVAFKEQERKIDRGVDVLIATPGRLLDHVERGKLVLLGVQILVVDEADRMLDMGFIPDVERICALVPPRGRQMLFFSATMAPEISRLTKRFLNDPVRVEVARQSTTADTVEQGLAFAAPRQKRAVLRKLLDQEDIKNAIVFCNRKRDVTDLYQSLQKNGYSVGALHGDIPQNLRTQTLDGFRNNEISILVASDVAARGLDIPAVSHVFNFDAPFHAEDYVHRIGRTGRAGREGKAYTLVGKGDDTLIEAIESLIKKPIPYLAGFEGQSASTEEPAGETKDAAPAPKKKAPAKAKAAAEPNEDAAPASNEENTAAPKNANREGSRNNNRDGGRNNNRDGGRNNNNGRARRNGDNALTARGPDKPVIGMGDHVPAFLMRPVNRPKKAAATTGAEESPTS